MIGASALSKIQDICIKIGPLSNWLCRCRFLMQNETMIYGNARVSTAAQDDTGQVRQLKAAGCEKVFREKITGTTANRPQLKKLLKALAPGDVVQCAKVLRW